MIGREGHRLFTSHTICLTLTITRGGRTPNATTRRAPSARRRVHGVVGRFFTQAAYLFPWRSPPVAHEATCRTQRKCLAFPRTASHPRGNDEAQACETD